MKLLIAVEKMNAAETRATIIARNREKRRRRKERREKLKLERLKRQWRRKKENSVLPPDGFHASNSQKNFMKKKYYSRWVRVGDSFASQRFPELDPRIINMSILVLIMSLTVIIMSIMIIIMSMRIIIMSMRIIIVSKRILIMRSRIIIMTNMIINMSIIAI